MTAASTKLAEEPKSTLRPIHPIRLPAGTALETAGPRPELKYIPIDLLVINSDYQRGLSERSLTIIRKVATRFSWGRIKALSVAPIDGDRYEVIDGQHTAIAALSRGDIKELPCLVSSQKSLTERAGDFVGINQDRVIMTPLQVFWAKVAAEDELAVEVQQGVSRAGARVLKSPPGDGRYQPGDIVCVSTFLKLARHGGPIWVRRVAEIAIKAKLAPIKAQSATAIASLLWDSNDHGMRLQEHEITAVFRIHGQDDLIERARAMKKEIGQGSMGYYMSRVITGLAK